MVEGNAEIQETMRQRLSVEGYDVVTASDDSDALKVLRNCEGSTSHDDHGGIDLILLDDLLADDNGVELLQELRRTTTRIDLPIIMVTDQHKPEAVVRALKAEANDYVTKPIDFDVLLVRMETHLDLRASHRSLHESHRALVKAARMESVTQLAAGVAHEIRNPLAQIQMCFDGLGSGISEDNQPDREMHRMAVEAVCCAEAIVSTLIGYSDDLKLQLQLCDLVGFVNDALKILVEEFRAAGVIARVEVEEPSPVALLSEEELRQVLLNLLINASEAMPMGGEINIRLGTRTPENLPIDEGSRLGSRVRNGEPAAYIEIEDSGHGLSPQDESRAFDTFFTTRATGKRRGKGLGLSVCRKLVKLHGGHITLENRPDNVGARATVLLRQKETAML